MQPIDLNRKSWHYWVATKCGELPKQTNSTDICSYVTEVFKGSLLLLVLGLAGGFLVAEIGSTIWWLTTRGFVWFSAPAFVKASIVTITILLALVVIFVSVATIAGWIEDYRYKRWVLPKKQPSFLKLAYRSFRDKFCLKVNFK